LIKAQVDNRRELQKGFLGIKWGASNKDVISKMDSMGFKEYEVLGDGKEILFYGGSLFDRKTSSWFFEFNRDKELYAISSYFEKSYDKVTIENYICSTMAARYGNPISTDERGVIHHFQQTAIILEYHDNYGMNIVIYNESLDTK
jgi:hypothetical protein